jgi:hypothetical protein
LNETLSDCVIFSALLEFVLKEQEQPEYNGLSKEEAFAKYYESVGEAAKNKLSAYFM